MAFPPGGYVVTFTLPEFKRLERAVELASWRHRPAQRGPPTRRFLFKEVTEAVTCTAIEAPAIQPAPLRHRGQPGDAQSAGDHRGRRSFLKRQRQPRCRRRNSWHNSTSCRPSPRTSPIRACAASARPEGGVTRGIIARSRRSVVDRHGGQRQCQPRTPTGQRRRAATEASRSGSVDVLVTTVVARARRCAGGGD